jgi:hypothetical protein
MNSSSTFSYTTDHEAICGVYSMTNLPVWQHNNPLKSTITRVTLFAKKQTRINQCAEKAKPAPRYGGLVPPLDSSLLS